MSNLNELTKYVKKYEALKSHVEDACNRFVSEKELQLLLSDLLEVCEYEPCNDLFDELCFEYEGEYPENIRIYRLLRKEALK